MANLNKYFKQFNKGIRLTNSRRKDLKRSSKYLRKKIRIWYKDNKPNEEQPKFKRQGSLPTDTIVNPIPRYVEENGVDVKKLYYDIDDGCYHIGNKNKEERHLPSTYHSRIYEAIKGHTNIYPIDKNTCVRTMFSDGRHVDIPIYYMQSDIPELAHKRDGFIQSDPQEFTNWFNEKADKYSQIRRLVRYSKGWCDFRAFKNPSQKMPSGLVMSILIAENFHESEKRDDIALKETLVLIRRKLQRNFSCERPTAPKGENLLKDYTNKDYFLKKLDDFIEDATNALKEMNLKISTGYWIKHLGDRFPLGEDIQDANNSEGLATLIPSTTKPYCSDT